MSSILEVGNDPTLLTIRSTLLKLTGATVTAVSSNEAMEIVREQHFDLIVFCHTVSPPEREKISLEARDRHINVRVLSILRYSALYADHEEALPDPQHLLAKVNETLQKYSREQHPTHLEEQLHHG